MNYLQGTSEHEIYTMLSAGFCEHWPATHKREGFSGWPPCQRVAVQRKKLAANVSSVCLENGRTQK
jgi:hypothetical protein